ncbi:MAG: efflux transporter outer membrane subunit [Phycisphaerales bacterium]|nr:efflux transporter outer membrane subunit [Phycisphaerales bacterium]
MIGRSTHHRYASRRIFARRNAYTAVAMLAVLSLGASGCVVGPDYHSPDMAVPGQWHQSATEGLANGPASVEAWWQVFNDDTLSSLIKRAADNNLDVRMAILRVRAARSLRNVAVGELFPSLTGNSSYQRTKLSANSLFGGFTGAGGGLGPGKQFSNSVARGIAGSILSNQVATAAPGLGAASNAIGSSLIGLVPQPHRLGETDDYNLFANGFDANWELDVFGGLRRGVESADASLQARVEDYRTILVSLLAEVAATYVDVRSLQARVAATVRNIDLQEKTTSLTQSRFRHGLTTELDVHQADTNLATTQAELPVLQTALALSIYRLGVLIGREPSAVWDELSLEKPIPTAPAEVLVGTPVEILRRRPDIRSAERRLAAETAQIGVAASDLYPRFSLAGNFSFDAVEFEHALDSRSIAYGIGPAVRWNLFDGLRNLNRITAQEANAHQAFVGYEQTVLGALEEVEGAIVAYKREQERCDALSRAVDAAQRATKLAEHRYRDGLTDFQRVVDAQRTLVASEDALAQSRGQVVYNLVALYKALGGGWSADVVPQSEYLDAPSEATEHPVRYFFSGGKSDPDWVRDQKSHADATPATEMGDFQVNQPMTQAETNDDKIEN